MGIRGLQSFVSKCVNHGVINVDIKAEVEKYKRENNGTHPTIVIDILALHTILYDCKYEILLGGRYNIFNERTIKMFTNLKNLGINLAFFVDGPPQKDKFSTVLERRNEDYNNCVGILKAIDSETKFDRDCNGFKIENPTPFFSNLVEIAERFGKVRISNLNECDLELANFATESQALAIISNDSDFLIYEGNWRYWSSRDLDYNKLTTVEYNRSALRATLALSNSQMPLLATICGNDIMQLGYLEPFHKRQCRGWRFRTLAGLIRQLRSHPYKPILRDVRYFVNRMFPMSERDQMTDIFVASLNSYDYKKITHNYRNEVLNRISKFSDRFNYIVLENRPYIITLFYFDLPNPNFMSFFDLILPLIKRQMGILLQHLNDKNITRTFYCKRDDDESYRPYTEKPIYPEVEVPALLDMFYPPSNQQKDLGDTQIILACWCISEKLQPADILRLPRESVISVLIIFYLCEMKQITLDEADCLLLANHCNTEVAHSLKYEDISTISGRTARLSFLFAKMHFFICNCFYAVGLGKFCSLLQFDGLHFHSLMNKWKIASESEKIAGLQKYENLRIYADFFPNQRSVSRL